MGLMKSIPGTVLRKKPTGGRFPTGTVRRIILQQVQNHPRKASPLRVLWGQKNYFDAQDAHMFGGRTSWAVYNPYLAYFTIPL